MRVNARFEGAAAEQVQYLMNATDLSMSEVLRVSVEAYYRQVRAQQPATLRHLAPLVGQFHSGSADTSEHYKATLADAWDKKHPR